MFSCVNWNLLFFCHCSFHLKKKIYPSICLYFCPYMSIQKQCWVQQIRRYSETLSAWMTTARFDHTNTSNKATINQKATRRLAINFPLKTGTGCHTNKQKIEGCTCDCNGVTGSTCQQLHPAQAALGELSQTGLLWTNIPWPAMSSLAEFPTPPAKKTHFQLTMHPEGRKAIRKKKKNSHTHTHSFLKLYLH